MRHGCGCLSRFMFMRHDSTDPDNKLPRSGYIGPLCKGETGELTLRCSAWTYRVYVQVRRNKHVAIDSFSTKELTAKTQGRGLAI